jgi:steroid delta-isomerase-like uncharacterized protein
MSEKNKAIGRRVFEEVWAGKLDVADEIFDASYVAHRLGAELPPGPEGIKLFASVYRSAFPDVVMTVEDQIAEGDKVVTRWTARGTHQGELMGIPATGKPIVVPGISIGRFVGDKMVETWNSWDGLGMLQQLGVIPPMGKGGE